jgi:hypothetical protein
MDRRDCLPFTTPTLAGRAFINGFPGAGNVLATNLVRDIIGQNSGGLDEPLASLLIDNRSAIEGLLARAMPAGWPAGYSQPNSRGDADFCVPFGECAFVRLLRLPLFMHLDLVVHATHELPESVTQSFYARQGYTPFGTVRHPLDMIASLAAKHNWPEPAARSAKDGATRAKIADHTWLVATCQLMADFHEHIPSDALRYEDALRDPLGYVDTIAVRLQVEVTDPKQTASMIGTKEFRTGHFNQPGVGRWRQFFTARDLEAVPERLWTTFARFGYERPDLGQAGATSDASDNRSSWFDVLALLGTFTPHSLAKLYRVPLATAWAGRHLVVATAQELADEFAVNLTREAHAASAVSASFAQ